MKARLPAIVNIVLIPYVWIRFPKEAASYAKRSFFYLVMGK